jgi:hypothetical protein
MQLGHSGASAALAVIGLSPAAFTAAPEARRMRVIAASLSNFIVFSRADMAAMG